GLVVRGMLETMSDHNVDTFISLSAPQMGQYGDSSYLKPFLPKGAVKDVYKVFYTYFAQRTVSLANYWNDPYQQQLNLEENVFLPVINNNESSSMHNTSGTYNVLVNNQFGSYEDNSFTVKTMEEQEFFKEDSFGLKTLYDNGCVHNYTFTGVKHVHWHGNKQVFDKAIEPWLT
ncbi:hypothetical protein QZH41_012502, partial [Actinostola sp. cb2023]